MTSIWSPLTASDQDVVGLSHPGLDLAAEGGHKRRPDLVPEVDQRDQRDYTVNCRDEVAAMRAWYSELDGEQSQQSPGGPAREPQHEQDRHSHQSLRSGQQHFFGLTGIENQGRRATPDRVC